MRLFTPIFLSIAIAACIADSAFADKTWGVRRYNSTTNNITGAKTVLNGGWNHMTPAPLPAGAVETANFVNKDMWIILDATGTTPLSDGCWVEVMVKNGNYTADLPALAGLPSSFVPSYKGYSLAREVSSDQPGSTNMKFFWYPYGTNPSTSAETGGTLEINQTVPGTWQTKINGTTALTLSYNTCQKWVGNINTKYTPTGGSKVQWGIESLGLTNTFTKNTSMTAQVKLGTGAMSTPAANTVYEASNGTLPYTTTFSNGSIYITRP
jgi:hypothetical protein